MLINDKYHNCFLPNELKIDDLDLVVYDYILSTHQTENKIFSSQSYTLSRISHYTKLDYRTVKKSLDFLSKNALLTVIKKKYYEITPIVIETNRKARIPNSITNLNIDARLKAVLINACFYNKISNKKFITTISYNSLKSDLRIREKQANKYFKQLNEMNIMKKTDKKIGPYVCREINLEEIMKLQLELFSEFKKELEESNRLKREANEIAKEANEIAKSKETIINVKVDNNNNMPINITNTVTIEPEFKKAYKLLTNAIEATFGSINKIVDDNNKLNRKMLEILKVISENFNQAQINGSLEKIFEGKDIDWHTWQKDCSRIKV